MSYNLFRSLNDFKFVIWMNKQRRLLEAIEKSNSLDRHYKVVICLGDLCRLLLMFSSNILARGGKGHIQDISEAKLSNDPFV